MTTKQTGTVKWFNEGEGCGFIAPDIGGKDLFAHFRDVSPDLTFHLFAASPRNGAQRVGKYLVSPLIKALEDGSFASSVSIRSGSGSATTDRVLRLSRIFDCAAEAAAGAHAEARHWINESRTPRLACAS